MKLFLYLIISKKHIKNSSVKKEELEQIDISAMIASKIIKYRIEHELSQEDLAKKFGVSQKLISRWESGRNNFTLSTLEKISKVLGWNLANAFNQIDKKDKVRTSF